MAGSPIVAVAGGRGSPGASSLGLGLAMAAPLVGANQTILVEADEAGGVLGLRFGLPAEPNLSTFAGSATRQFSPSLLFDHTVALGQLRVMAAPTDPLVASWTLRRCSQSLATALAQSGHSAVIDLGRVSSESPNLNLAAVADVCVVVTRPIAEEAQSAMYAVRSLRAVGARCGIVCIGTKPFDPSELAELAGVPLLAVLPDDRDVASAFRGGAHSPRRLRRSLLFKSITELGHRILIPAGQSRTRTSPPAQHRPQPQKPPSPGPDSPAIQESAGASPIPAPQRPTRAWPTPPPPHAAVFTAVEERQTTQPGDQGPVPPRSSRELRR